MGGKKGQKGAGHNKKAMKARMVVARAAAEKAVDGDGDEEEGPAPSSPAAPPATTLGAEELENDMIEAVLALRHATSDREKRVATQDTEKKVKECCAYLRRCHNKALAAPADGTYENDVVDEQGIRWLTQLEDMQQT
jgi:hypothetical protein